MVFFDPNAVILEINYKVEKQNLPPPESFLNLLIFKEQNQDFKVFRK